MGFWADAKSIAERDPAAKGPWEVFWLYSGYHAVCWHRCAHWLYRHKFFFIARLISQLNRFFSGVEIHPGATIGRGLFIDHGMGIVIGETAEIGDHCTIYHNVTLGGTGKQKNKKRHPTIGNNVLIGTGSKVLGPVTVGDNARIGANSVVLKDVPPNATVIGVPGHPVTSSNQANPSYIASEELDQINLPDPVYQELLALMAKVDAITKAAAKRACPAENNGEQITNCPSACTGQQASAACETSCPCPVKNQTSQQVKADPEAEPPQE